MEKKIYKSAAELIGGSPLLELCGIEKKFDSRARIIAKLEYLNPAGSVKDRAAKAMLEAAEKSGALKPGSTIIEPTSGNTGIALSALAAAKGYKIILAMPESMSVERRKLARAYGAKIELTPASLGMKGAIDRAKELASEIPDSFIPGQFENPANPEIHKKTTGPEIYSDLRGEIDFFVAGAGTGGTITGVGEYLKERSPAVKIVAVEPASSPVLSGGKPGPHKIQGIGAGFEPKILNRSVIDEIIPISDEEAFSAARAIGKTEGFLAGISSGAALAAALKIAERKEAAGKTIVVLFPDGGERYLSTALYEDAN